MSTKKLIRNSYFNPHGKGFVLTKNKKLGLISAPLRLFWKDDNSVQYAYDRYMYCTAIFPDIGSWDVEEVEIIRKLNTTDPYFTTSDLDSWLNRRQRKQIYVSRLYDGSSRPMTFWVFGKKISLELEYGAGKLLADTSVDSSGHVWVNGEDRGIW